MNRKQEYLRKIEECILQGPYSDDWDSLSRHETPQWFRDDKFGIFVHWGVYSVPAFANEWYPRTMYMQGSPEYEHHRKTYGDHKEFGYKDFIPMFRAEKFDPEEWLSLFEEAGARYLVPVAEHHDGFQMYQSEISHWNAVEMGPKRDVLGELRAAADRHGLLCGASTHRIEHWFFMGHGREFDSDITDQEKEGDFYWPAMPERDLQDLYSTPVPSQEFLEDWMVRTCELIDRYRIRQLYFDWWIQHSSAKPYLRKIAAYYYNRAVEWGEEVMITYKHDAFMFGCATVDIERGHFAESKPFPWQTDTAVARNSWCYTENNDFKSARSLVCDLVDIVSKNGCLLLNVGPKADGTITEQDQAVLREIGAWLKKNGACIYGTRPWRIAQEGPTRIREGGFTDGEEIHFTAEDFRFTVKGDSIYAVCLSMPEDGRLCIRSLGEQDASHLPNFHGIIDSIEALDGKLVDWTRKEEGLFLQVEETCAGWPAAFRIILK